PVLRSSWSATFYLYFPSPCFRRTRRYRSSTLFPYTTLFRSCRRLGLRTHHSSPSARGGASPLGGRRRKTRDVRSTPSGTRHRERDRKSTRLNSSHGSISYAVFCLRKKTYGYDRTARDNRLVD